MLGNRYQLWRDVDRSGVAAVELGAISADFEGRVPNLPKLHALVVPDPIFHPPNSEPQANRHMVLGFCFSVDSGLAKQFRKTGRVRHVLMVWLKTRGEHSLTLV